MQLFACMCKCLRDGVYVDIFVIVCVCVLVFLIMCLSLCVCVHLCDCVHVHVFVIVSFGVLVLLHVFLSSSVFLGGECLYIQGANETPPRNAQMQQKYYNFISLL